MRPLHLRPRYLGLAFLGGMLGTGLRYGLTLLLPGAGGGQGAVLAANVLGAFLLGLLLEGLTRRGPDQGARRSVRLLVGTGLLGGFTTYSSLAVATAELTARDGVLIGLGYPLVSLVLGLGAALLGVVLAQRVGPAGPAREVEDA